jgi:hypothetical protein
MDIAAAMNRAKVGNLLEHPCMPLGKQGAEHDAGQHLADHGRLPEAPEQQAEQPGGAEDQHQLQQQR